MQTTRYVLIGLAVVFFVAGCVSFLAGLGNLASKTDAWFGLSMASSFVAFSITRFRFRKMQTQNK